MKKTLIIFAIVLAALLVVPVINLLGWVFESQKQMNIVVVDKTVPTLDRLKHKSLFWVLKNDKFVKKDSKKAYSYKSDYYGFYPTRPLKSRLWERHEYRLVELTDIADQSDAIYFADTYGVFFNDWYQGSSRSRRSRRLYGGLNNNDNLLIKEMMDRDKLVVMEYNSFDYPTSEYESYRIQERLGVQYSGWTGKYFASLDTTSADFPVWMTAIYRKQYKQPWTFSKEGIVMLKNNNIIVLEKDTHLTSAMPFIYSDSLFVEKWNLAESVPFDQWFDVVEPMGTQVISSFKLETNVAGDELLSSQGLINSFPAVVRDMEGERIYYFSGDFTHYDVCSFSSIMKGAGGLKQLHYSKHPTDVRRFFWLYYRPLIEGVFNDYYNSK